MDSGLAATRRPGMTMKCAPLRRLRPQRRNLAHVLFAFGMPGIVSALHADPDRGAVAEQFAEPNRDRRGNRLPFAQYVIEMLPGNAEKLRNLGLCLLYTSRCV